MDGVILERSGYSIINKNMLTQNVQVILKEIDQVLSQVDEKQVDEMERMILGANVIVCVGAGRVGLAVKGFAMRLGHFGKTAFMIGDTTVPHIGEGDLLLVCSGSGETQTIYDLVEIAKKNKASIALITGNAESRMGQLADAVVEVKAPSKTKNVAGFVSVQPMTTLNEQSLGIFLDALVLKLMNTLGETHDTMWERHSNLE